MLVLSGCDGFALSSWSHLHGVLCRRQCCMVAGNSAGLLSKRLMLG